MRDQASGHRGERMAAEITRAMQDLLARGLSDPRIRGLITVTGVVLSDDRREAVVKISVLPAEQQALTMHGLRAATGRLRREAMGRVRSRNFPQIRFEPDAAYKQEQEVLAAIARASSELPPEAVPAVEAPVGEEPMGEVRVADEVAGGSGDGADRGAGPRVDSAGDSPIDEGGSERGDAGASGRELEEERS
ncbi:MAG: 30S ribosome-binding factor RbfA [Planctomycetota bacterium]